MRQFFTDDSLEDFLKQNSDRFQMRPSDKVWKGISDNLKRRNRRIGWFTGFFLVAASLSGYLVSQHAAAPAGQLGLRQAGNAAGTSAAGTSGEGAHSSGAVRNTGTRTAQTALSLSTAASIPSSNTAAATTQRSGKGARIVRFRSRGAGTSTPLPASNPAASYNSLALDASRNSQGTDELDRLYTDASLAAPATNLLTRSEQPGNNEAKAALAKLPEDRLSLQFFFTPTLSYRSLTENKEFVDNVPQANAAPNTYALYNINDAVTHKPSIGLELGLSARYALAHNLKIQGGVQFNMSRYVVQAFDNYAAQTATMAYNGGGSSSRTTQYSNLDGGGRKENLQNMYFQVSAPMGVELKIAGNSRTQIGITSTIQPTYILSDRVYMLSTDYKTYAEVPWLIRRWNVNTALSTYVGYSTGKLAWQVGPQVRYQLMSSFVSKYPVKENLFDFGLRVGVSLNKGH